MISYATRTQFTFDEYMALTTQLVAEGRTTGPIQTADYVHYTELNLRRMQRITKTAEIQPELAALVQALPGPQTWLVLTEPWCGDAAQNVPVIAMAAALNPEINLRLILRDDNLDLMDQHLTNGGRSIPKLIILDGGTDAVLGTWGPRPKGAQDMVVAYKHMENKPPYSEFVIEVQKWYAQDKTLSCQQELAALLHTLVD
jgi:Thioredoxin